jgi:two-component system, LuxR family, response regulator FixJ
MSERTVFVVEDDVSVRESLRALLESADLKVIDFASAVEFLNSADERRGSCIIADVRMPGMNGLEMQEELVKRGSKLPVIIITGHGDVAMAVQAMKVGAIDFLEKPFDDETLLDCVHRALDAMEKKRDLMKEAEDASQQISRLTRRELEVLEQLVAGRSNKLVARELSISPRTVEIHRARIMDKLKARGLSDLVRTAIAASIRMPTDLGSAAAQGYGAH